MEDNLKKNQKWKTTSKKMEDDFKKKMEDDPPKIIENKLKKILYLVFLQQIYISFNISPLTPHPPQPSHLKTVDHTECTTHSKIEGLFVFHVL